MDASGGLGPPPTGRERLAAELRKLRDIAGVSGRELAQRIGISQSKVSRIESGAVVPSLPEVTAWGKELGVSVETQARLTGMIEAAYNEVHPWGAAVRLGNLQEGVQEQESTATRIAVFQPSVVPGLLQIAGYAQRVIALFHRQYTETDQAAEIASRLDRQLALYDTRRHFDFLVTEAALRWRPGPAQLLIAQLERIMSIGSLENVSIGLIPLSAQATTLTSHGFVMYEGEHQDSWVTVETIHADMKVAAPEHMEIYRSRWSLLRKMALFDADAQEFLGGIVDDLRSGQVQ
jgi:transcriptional regulator with XRE-family HTH domain